MSLLDGFRSLGKELNTVKPSSTDGKEGASGVELDVLDLEKTDVELIDLKEAWEKAWSETRDTLRKMQDQNENYWLNKQYSNYDVNDRPLVDNRIFPAVESFLPIATRQNPEPIVEADESPIGIRLAKLAKISLEDEADRTRLRLKIKQVARHWSLYFVGAIKVGYSNGKKQTEPVRIHRLILDPEATIDAGGVYRGEYIGEIKRTTAKKLIDLYPNSKDYITEKVKGKLGTQVNYVEWWTNEYIFWTLDKELLDKSKNPHWNYDETTQQTSVDEMGVETVNEVTVLGKNHFESPQMPYLFLSIFNLGTSPFDQTGLIWQSLSLQDLVNKRLRQTDANADNINGGWVVSEEKSGLTKEQANRAILAVRKGYGLHVKRGSPQEAVHKVQGTPLPAEVYNQMVDARQEIDNIMGTHATTRGERTGQETASGRLLLKTQDESRIGLIADHIEQMVDTLFNWWVQLDYVYTNTPEIAAEVFGKKYAEEWLTLIATPDTPKLLVSVKEGSLLPRDETTKRNEALDLWKMNAIDPITFYDRLGFPDPLETARQVFLWQSNPAAYLGLQSAQPQSQPPPEQVIQ